MKTIHDRSSVSRALSDSRYKDIIAGLGIPVFLCEYEKGELVTAPDFRNDLFLIVISGSISIYFIRTDGSSYHLAYSESDTFIGETELFGTHNNGVYAEAAEELVCVAFYIRENRAVLLKNAAFLRVIAESLVEKMAVITDQDAVPCSLKERVLAYMNYICEDRTLKGVEKAAYQLHCSPRHLQRILNKLEVSGIIKKAGKGTYTML